jgi:aclacinomycin oxidase
VLAVSDVARREAGRTATTEATGPPGAISVRPGDTRYRELVTRGYNRRFTARPESVHLVHTTGQVVRIVTDAVRAGKRIAVRSGGHCFENLVDDAAVRVLVDLSEMNAVYFDPVHRAFAVSAGATLASMYRTLCEGWGVTVPGGECPEIGVGGHIVGGGFGPLSRRDGLIVDHLYAVEVVVVDRSGQARAEVATRDPADPNHDLWWAHTGGGGGNFGIVTRYWFRSTGAHGNDPSTLLPPAPKTLAMVNVAWPWRELTEQAFTRLVRNHGQWHAENSADGSPYASLWSQLTLTHRSLDEVSLIAQLDGALPDADQLMNAYITALTAGVGVTPAIQRSTPPWLTATLDNALDTGPLKRTRSKDAFLRTAWSDAQAVTAHRYLNDSRMTGLGAIFLYSYGGRINAVPPEATAVPQRDSILRAWLTAFWASSAQDPGLADWIRDCYRDLYADAGGVPAPGARYDGVGINFPDTDLISPQWNCSGIPWQTLYYRDNYPRLRQVKARWDPRNVFHHALAVEPAG